MVSWVPTQMQQATINGIKYHLPAMEELRIITGQFLEFRVFIP